ncbi:MAG: ATP-binding protein [Candidatus Thermoplasmatota archaeon]|nr:ATP-binding protein [Candidatus Thermoplasmatota archaeon]
MEESIQRWNIWWENPEEIIKYIGTERTLLTQILQETTIPHIKDIIGVRRCGKTILMYQIMSKLIKENVNAKNILYLNFDDPELTDLEETIKTSLHINPEISHVFLDEIQNVKEWEKTIRVYYDRKKFKQIFVSGSSASLISRDIGRTLTGRHVTTLLTPFSFKEYLLHQGIKQPAHISHREKVIHYLEKYIKNGGFPETINTDPLTSKAILLDLYNDILSRDIAARFEAEMDIVKKIGYYMMTNIGALFSYNSVAKALNLHYDTVKKYIPYFEEVFLFIIIPYFSWKIKTTLKKDMKCYAIDTGLRNAVSFKFSEDLGKLAENLVIIELKRRGKDVYFWKGKHEVDCIIKEGNKVIALNITYSNKISEREKEGLLEFKEKYKNVDLVIITKELEQRDDEKIQYIPLWKWLLEIEENRND